MADNVVEIEPETDQQVALVQGAPFLDLPEAIETVEEIVGKCEPYGLASDVLLPAFDIPEE